MIMAINDDNTKTTQEAFTFNNPKKLQIVDGDLAEAGCVTYFSFTGEVAHAALLEAAEKAGLDSALLPKLPGPEVALRRAVESLRDKHRLVRSNEDGEYCVVDEIVVGKELEYRVVLRCGLTPEKELVSDLDERAVTPFTPTTLEAYDQAKEVDERIRGEFVAGQNKYVSQDISQWLSKMLRRLKAVTLRTTGGVYFVPRTTLPEFKKIVHTLSLCSRHVVFEIPAMSSDETVKAVLDALLSEAQSEVDRVTAELDASQDAAGAGEKGLGKRALTSRVKSLDALKEKLASYETLLGVRLEAISDRLQDVRANVTLAILATEPEQ